MFPPSSPALRGHMSPAAALYPPYATAELIASGGPPEFDLNSSSSSTPYLGAYSTLQQQQQQPPSPLYSPNAMPYQGAYSTVHQQQQQPPPPPPVYSPSAMPYQGAYSTVQQQQQQQSYAYPQQPAYAPQPPQRDDYYAQSLQAQTAQQYRSPGSRHPSLTVETGYIGTPLSSQPAPAPQPPFALLYPAPAQSYSNPTHSPIQTSTLLTTDESLIPKWPLSPASSSPLLGGLGGSPGSLRHSSVGGGQRHRKMPRNTNGDPMRRLRSGTNTAAFYCGKKNADGGGHCKPSRQAHHGGQKNPLPYANMQCSSCREATHGLDATHGWEGDVEEVDDDDDSLEL